MRLPLLAIALLGSGLLAAGCGGREDSTPVACLEGAHTYLTALGKAPGEVRLAGATPISDCLARNQQGGDLATVGQAMLDAAVRLNGRARANPGDRGNVELGYLLGVARRGSAGTEGIHVDLIRRLTAAARYSPRGSPLPAAFRRAYRRGYEAGAARG
jgi:hypothetical protein